MMVKNKMRLEEERKRIGSPTINCWNSFLDWGSTAMFSRERGRIDSVTGEKRRIGSIHPMREKIAERESC